MMCPHLDNLWPHLSSLGNPRNYITLHHHFRSLAEGREEKVTNDTVTSSIWIYHLLYFSYDMTLFIQPCPLCLLPFNITITLQQPMRWRSGSGATFDVGNHARGTTWVSSSFSSRGDLTGVADDESGVQEWATASIDCRGCGIEWMHHEPPSCPNWNSTHQMELVYMEWNADKCSTRLPCTNGTFQFHIM